MKSELFHVKKIHASENFAYMLIKEISKDKFDLCRDIGMSIFWKDRDTSFKCMRLNGEIYGIKPHISSFKEENHPFSFG